MGEKYIKDMESELEKTNEENQSFRIRNEALQNKLKEV